MSSDTTATDKRRGERDGGKKKEEEEEEEDKYKTNKTKEKSNHQSYLQLTLRPGLALVHTLCKVQTYHGSPLSLLLTIATRQTGLNSQSAFPFL